MGVLQKTTEFKKNNQIEFFHGDLTYKINGVLIEVYKELGRYAREKQYGDLIEKKFNSIKINFHRELVIGDSGNVADFIIEDKIILELKTVPFLIKEHFNQIKRYLHQTNFKLGILINFHTNYIVPKRVLNEEFKY